MDEIPQLSNEPLLICAAVMMASPLMSSGTVMFWHMAVGAMKSSPFTEMEFVVEVQPFKSVAMQEYVPVLVTAMDCVVAPVFHR